MKKIVSIIVLIVMLFHTSCSRQTDSFVNRAYHQVTTEYNIIFNGREKLNEGIYDLKTNYSDNFQEILPVEPMPKPIEDVYSPRVNPEEQAGGSNFDIAEEKAVKAVQKHSMSINGEERNSQIDDAYLLLGEARYYGQRYVPALEAFNFILDELPESDLKNVAQLWKGKTLIRLQNEILGIRVIQEMLEEEDVKSSIIEQGHTALAMGFLALNDNESAIEHLNSALETTQDRDQQARNTFILGQLFEQSGDYESAIETFQSLLEVNRIPQKYKIQSYLKLAELDDNTSNNDYYISQLKRMLKNPLSKPYFDEIYYGLSALSFNNGQEEKALNYLHQSLSIENSDSQQKARSYQRLGDYYYDKSAFVTAGMYYDSLVPYIKDSKSKANRQILRKHESLKDVVFYEGILSYNDSILRLVDMDIQNRENFFKDLIEKQKAIDKLAAQDKDEKKKSFGLPRLRKNTSQNLEKKGVWYFYNPQAVGFGQTEFKMVWGDRPLTDNWRWSQQSIGGDLQNDFENEKSEQLTGLIDHYSLDYYMSSVPSNPVLIDKLKHERSEANYQLGLIYKERLKDNKLAKARLEQFLNEDPIPDYILPAKYHLYKIYNEMNDPRAQSVYDDIVKNAPESRYALLLQNKLGDVVSENESTPEKYYESVYKLYQNKQYEQVIEQCDRGILLNANTPIHPKFELLKAYAQYHLQGEEVFVGDLKYIISNFPKTVEAEHAQTVLNKIKGTTQNKNIRPGETEKEKRQRVLDMMKKKGPPAQENEKDE